jgi:hypothetical protein
VKVNSGQDLQARNLGGGVVGVAGTATSTTSTTLTNTGAAFGSLVGHVVVAGSVYGVILSNTGTVLTVDRWYNPATPGGAAGSTPSGTSPYMVLPGGAPAWYMALSTDGTAPSATDTTLASEITTAGGGLVRQLATFAHTVGAAGYTLTGSFVANGADSLPATVQKVATFNSLVSGHMFHESLLSSSAPFTAPGDQLVVTETVNT